jgi:hypothetical protein
MNAAAEAAPEGGQADVFPTGVTGGPQGEGAFCVTTDDEGAPRLSAGG